MNLEEMTNEELSTTFGRIHKILEERREKTRLENRQKREAEKDEFFNKKESKNLIKKLGELIKKAKALHETSFTTELVLHLKFDIDLVFYEDDLFNRNITGNCLFDREVKGKVMKLEGISGKKGNYLKSLFDDQLRSVLKGACDEVYDLFPEIQKDITQIAKDFDKIKNTLCDNGFDVHDLKDRV